MEYPSFVGGSYKANNPFAANELTINWYPAPLESEGALARWHLVPTPGVAVWPRFDSVGLSGPGRAFGLFNGRLFAVLGSAFVEFVNGLPGGIISTYGTIAGTPNRATMAYNGTGGHQIHITGGGISYIFDTVSGVLTLATNQSPSGMASSTAMLDGYFFMLDQAANTVYQSALLDGNLFNSLDKAQRIVADDPWRQIGVLGKELFLLGQHTSEVWYGAGTFPFTIAPHPSGAIEIGIAADFSLAKVGSSLFWLAQTRNVRAQVVQADGLQPQVVSDLAVQAAMGRYARIDDAIGFAFADVDGHEFYGLTFPSGDTTWCYDLMTRRWHERRTWYAEQSRWGCWRPLYHARFDGQNLTLSLDSPDLLQLVDTLGTDLDRPVRRVRQAPHVTNQLERIYFSRFRLHLHAGQGAISGQGVDPMVELQVSNDGGETFYSEGYSGAGRLGEYNRFPEWTRLGSAENRQFRIETTDPTPWRIVGAYLDAK